MIIDKKKYGQLLSEIEKRIRPSICNTYSSRGNNREGVILEADLDIIQLIAAGLIEEEFILGESHE